MSNMFNFKYEIKINDKGRPYVHISEETEEHAEHKFMAIEVTRYLLNELLKDNEEMKEMSEDDVIAIASAGHLLEQVGNRIAHMIVEQKNALNDLGLDIEVQDE